MAIPANHAIKKDKEITTEVNNLLEQNANIGFVIIRCEEYYLNNTDNIPIYKFKTMAKVFKNPLNSQPDIKLRKSESGNPKFIDDTTALVLKQGFNDVWTN